VIFRFPLPRPAAKCGHCSGHKRSAHCPVRAIFVADFATTGKSKRGEMRSARARLSLFKAADVASLSVTTAACAMKSRRTPNELLHASRVRRSPPIETVSVTCVDSGGLPGKTWGEKLVPTCFESPRYSGQSDGPLCLHCLARRKRAASPCSEPTKRDRSALSQRGALPPRNGPHNSNTSILPCLRRSCRA